MPKIKNTSLYIRIPSYRLGNIGDEAMIYTICHYLDKLNLPNGYSCPMQKYKCREHRVANKYSALIYFGTDCLAYYSISVDLIKAFIAAKKPVIFINCSYGPPGTTKNDSILAELLSSSYCHLIVRDKLSHTLMGYQFNHCFPIQSADIVFNIPLPPPILESTTSDTAVLPNIFANTVISEWWCEGRQRMKAANGHTLIINLHEDFGSKDNNDRVLNAVVGALTDNKYWLARELKAGRLYVIFLAHDTRKPEVKRMTTAANNIHANIRASIGLDELTLLNKNIVVSPCLTLEQELQLLQGGISAILTGRMHLGILGLRCGVPAAAIAYNGIKAKGTFELFKNPVCGNILIASQPSNNKYEKWYNYIKDSVVDDMVYDMMDRKRDEYIECIREGLPTVQKMAGWQIGHIKKICGLE